MLVKASNVADNKIYIFGIAGSAHFIYYILQIVIKRQVSVIWYNFHIIHSSEVLYSKTNSHNLLLINILLNQNNNSELLLFYGYFITLANVIWGDCDILWLYY